MGSVPLRFLSDIEENESETFFFCILKHENIVFIRLLERLFISFFKLARALIENSRLTSMNDFPLSRQPLQRTCRKSSFFQTSEKINSLFLSKFKNRSCLISGKVTKKEKCELSRIAFLVLKIFLFKKY